MLASFDFRKAFIFGFTKFRLCGTHGNLFLCKKKRKDSTGYLTGPFSPAWAG